MVPGDKMRGAKIIFAVLAAGLLLLSGLPAASPQGPPPQAPPPEPQFAINPSPEDLAQGKLLFQGECGECHGVDGSGAAGPNLHGVAQRRGDQGLFSVIRNGIPGTGMAPVSNLNDKRAWQVVAYIRTDLGGSSSEQTVTGDATKGKAAYDANGCAVCHAIGDKGGGIGPQLTRIGAERSPKYLHDFLLDPGANPPSDSSLPERGSFTGYLLVHVVTKDGRDIEGIRINEDTFTIQLEDAGGHYYSFDKSGLKEMQYEPGKSVMPSFRSLSPADLNDLVAYLSSLKGGQ
jgi:cytochrome c oxidase cbb3-type subunit III